MYNDYLMHHGIKGMRWGVRKRRTTLGYGVRRRMRSDVQQPRTAEEAKRARRRKIAKRVAIGVGAAAAIAGTAYAVKRHREHTNQDISEFYRKANLAWARGDGGKDFDTFNSKRGNYSRRQLSRIAKAHKYGDSKDFHKAVNVRADGRTLRDKVYSTSFRAKHVVRDSSEKVAGGAKAGASKIASGAKSGASKAASTARETSRNVMGATKKAAGSAKSAVSKAKNTWDDKARQKVYDTARRVPLSSTGEDDYARELLKRNARRLAAARRG